MFHRTLPGFIEVICGSMFSGKTEELVRRLKRAQIARQKVQVFKPEIDNRYSADHVQSHDASRILSRPVKTAHEILELVENNTRVVGIDEAQFFDHSVVDVAQKLAYRGIRVIVAGLDMDFRGQPFGPMPTLLAIADTVTKLSAVCMVCGAPASRSQRVAAPRGNEKDEVVVGAKDMYEARCRFCHEPEGGVSATEKTSDSDSPEASESSQEGSKPSTPRGEPETSRGLTQKHMSPERAGVFPVASRSI